MADSLQPLLVPPVRPSVQPLRPLLPQREEEEEKGILGTLLSELGKDLKGAAKTAAAIGFTPLDVLGVSVPVSFDDITKRDLLGGASVLSMFAGGAAVNSLRVAAAGGKAATAGLTAQQVVRQLPKWQAIATAAAGEASAGALFGALKPLEQGESRLEEIIQDTMLFGGLGGFGGVLGASWRATIGNRLADIKFAKSAIEINEGILRQEEIGKLQEFVGFRFSAISIGDSKTGVLQRTIDGKLQFADEAGKEIIPMPDNIQEAMAKLVSRGYGHFEGPAKSVVPPKELVEELQLKTLADASAPSLAKLMDEGHAANYKGYRNAVLGTNDGESIFDSGLYDIVRRYDENSHAIPKDVVENEFRTIYDSIPPVMRTQELDDAYKSLKDGSNVDSAQFVKEAMKVGALRIEQIQQGTDNFHLFRELALNDRVNSDALAYVTAGSADATLLDRVVTGSGITKLHPEAEAFWSSNPLLKHISMKEAARRVSLGSSSARKWLNTFPDKYSKETMQKTLQIFGGTGGKLEDFKTFYSMEGGEISRAGAELRDFFGFYQLREVGRGIDNFTVQEHNPAVMKETLRKLDDYLDDVFFFRKETDAISLDEQLTAIKTSVLSGPEELAVFDDLWEHKIAQPFNVDSSTSGWGVRVNNGAIQEFATREEALKVALESGKAAEVQPMIAITQEAYRVGSVKEIRKFVEARLAQGRIKVDADELAEAGVESVEEYIRQLTIRERGLQAETKLVDSLATFSQDPFRNLNFFSLGKESSIAYHPLKSQQFENAIEQLIPDSKPMLKKLIRTKRDLLSGKRTWEEQVFDNFFSTYAPEVSRIQVKKISGAIRHGQGLFKLGGVWSGLINSTQYLTNSVPVLGVKYAAEGMKMITDGKTRKEFLELVRNEKLDLGFHDSLISENASLVSDQILPFVRSAAARRKLGNNAAAFKAMQEAGENMWMYMFNGAERINRGATAYGAYRKELAALSRGGKALTPDDHKKAVRKAVDVVNRTQFSYNSDNIPMIMQGPVGSVLFQFKSFFVNQMEFMAGLNAQERARFVGMMGALGGFSSMLDIPGVDVADHLSSLVFDAKISEASRIAEQDFFDKEQSSHVARSVMRFGMYGAPGLGGIDVSKYIGPGSVMDMTRGFLGPTVSDAKDFLEFGAEAIRDVNVTGNIRAETLEKLALRVGPSQVRRAVNGRRIVDTGQIRSSYTGKLLYEPEKRYFEGVLAAVGASTVRTETARALDDYVERQAQDYRGVRSSFRKEIALSLIGGNQNHAAELQERARTNGIVFTPGDLKRAVDDFSKDARQRRLERTPAAVRQQTVFDLESLSNF